MSLVFIGQDKSIVGSPLDFSRASLDSVTNLVREVVYNSCDFKNLVSGKNVLIKPNLVRPIANNPCTITDPRVIYSIALLTFEAGAAKVTIGDKPGWKLSARSVFEAIKIKEILKDLDVQICYFDEDECIEIDLPEARVFNKIRVPRTVVESDVLINVPKLKTHMQTTVSLGIKNLYGLILDDQRLLYHRNDLNYKLVDILRLKTPSLTVIDGIWPMEGQSPHYGEAVKDFNVIVAGTDVVAVDAVACLIMDIDPFEVDKIRIAHMEGLGCGDLSSIRIIGKEISEIRRRFKRACISSAGVYPNVLCIEAGACLGCLSSVRHSLDRLSYERKIENLKPITIYVGKPMPGSSPIARYEGDLWFFGNCACELLYNQRTGMKQGGFVPGCPPYISDLYEALSKEYKL
ncbi:MAG: DUF362 domain-containing protein [archaeon]|nr:DUF362 domain-containing protein [archaeon]